MRETKKVKKEASAQRGTQLVRMGRIYKILEKLYVHENTCMRMLMEGMEQDKPEVVELAKTQAKSIRLAINTIKEGLEDIHDFAV